MLTTAFKQVADNAVSTTGTSYASTGVTSTTVATGDGSKFPAPGNGFYLTIWTGLDPNTDANMEKVLVTARSGDVLTHSATTKTHTGTVNIGLLDVAQNTVDIQAAINAIQTAALDKTGDTMTGALINTLASGNSLVFDTSTLVVDATNHRVGMGTATPDYASTVYGTTSTSANNTLTGSLFGVRDTTGNQQLTIRARGNSTGLSRTFPMQLIASGSGGLDIYAISATTLNLGTNSAARITIDGAGLVGFGTTAPTHTITLPSTGTGIAIYNTTDQTTNYERGLINFTSNVFTVQAGFGGTGIARDARFGNANRYLHIQANSSSAGGYQLAGGTTAVAGAVGVSVTYTSTAASGVFVGLQVNPTINQTVSGGYTALQVNAVETAVGSGANLLADFQVGGVSKATINNTGRITSTVEMVATRFRSSGANSNNGLVNDSSGGNAAILPNTTGTQITRNVADANVVLSVQQINASATGDLLQLKNSAATVVSFGLGGATTIAATGKTAISLSDTTTTTGLTIGTDTNLYRSGAGILSTDGSTVVGVINTATTQSLFGSGPNVQLITGGITGGLSESVYTQYQGRATVGYNGATTNAALQGGTGKGVELTVNGTTIILKSTSAGQMAIGSGAVGANGVLTIGTSTTVASGGLFFGADTLANIYRSAPGVLKTDGSLILATAGTAAGSVATIDGTQTLTNKTATHLALTAGTTTVSPLFINAGTNKTTPVSGDIEFDGNDLFFTNATARQTVVTTGKTQTLALKTLTSPVINTGTVGADPVTALGIASKQYVDTQAATSSVIVNEVPGGSVNGSNTTFTTASNFATGSLAVTRNGIRLKGGGVDFTATTGGFTMVTAPLTGDLLLVDYLVSNTAFSVGTNSVISNETPTGLVNSSNAVYAAARAYVSGSLEVWIDGIYQKRGTDYTETTPASGTFTMTTAPVTGQTILVNYQYNLNPSGNSDTVDGIHGSSFGGVSGQVVVDNFGWQDISNLALTYASVDGHTFTFTVPGDQTAWFRKYCKLRLTQTTVKYFVVSLDSTFAAGVTTVTVYGGQNYALANAAISLPSISYQRGPAGFPLSPTGWREEYIDGTDRVVTNVANTWININGAALVTPIGDWSIEYQVMAYANASVQVDTTLSTANNSDSSSSRMVFSKDSATFGLTHRNRDDYVLTAKTTLYLNTRGSTAANIYNLNSRGMSLIIRAVSTLI